ncbi:HAD family phosphatase [Candidatus Woesearchaeota archaeon]|nr:HAD family phosphatase [Candidatus Woesearchaeota archaeon]
MVKAIIFDLGNVIIKFDEAPTFRKWAECGNKPFSDVKKYHGNSPARKSFERGEITPKQFYSKYTRDLGLKIRYNDFVDNYCDIFTINWEVEEIIKSLKGKIRLVLLSNTNVLQYEYCKKRFKVLKLFDERIASHEVGMRKPNPFIFLKAVQKAGVLPFNCAYFDDIAEFIYAARCLGIRAFQYKNTEKLRKDLKKIRVL